MLSRVLPLHVNLGRVSAGDANKMIGKDKSYLGATRRPSPSFFHSGSRYLGLTGLRWKEFSFFDRLGNTILNNSPHTNHQEPIGRENFLDSDQLFHQTVHTSP